MNPQDDIRRKFICVTNYKGSVGANNIMTGKEWKRNDVSREKEEKKIIMDRPALKINTLTHQVDDNCKTNPKTINFKNLKETVSKKQATATLQKNIMHPVVKPVQYFGKNIRSPPQSHGISINVNIQNMISQKQIDVQQPLQLSDRSILPEDKKSKKIVSAFTQKVDDFECKEQLVYKRTPIEKQNKFPDKTIQKRPLIDRKHNKAQTLVPKPKQKQKIIDIKEQLKKFQSQIQVINSTAQSQSVSYLDYRQQAYLIPPHYIEKNQKNFNWKMRVTLFEWMMHVSYQFSIKRQTFYIAVNLVDLFLSKQWNLQRTDFQLAGTAAMFIASKLEQFQPKCSDQFAKATKKYSALEVKEMQKRICKTLKYTLNPPTLSTWANRFMLQWDTYLQQNGYSQKHPIFATCQQKFFKKCDTQSYRRYRTVMQYLDCATLDIQTVQYQPKMLVCAFMYLVLGNNMGIFTQQKILKDFPRSSLYLLDEDNMLNDLFANFLESSFNIMLIDMLPTVQYCATYYGLQLNYEDPITPPGSDLENIEFEDYCSYQTYNPSAKSYVFNSRFRGMYE